MRAVNPMEDQLIDPADVRRLLTAADVELRAAISLGYYAGLSSLEMASLWWADVDFKLKAVRIGRGLGVRLRVVPMHPALQAQLSALRKRSGGREVFEAPQAITRLREKLRAISEPLGLGHVCFRDFQLRFRELSQRASEMVAVMAFMVGNKKARKYVLYTKLGRMRRIELDKFRRVISCFSDLLHPGEAK